MNELLEIVLKEGDGMEDFMRLVLMSLLVWLLNCEVMLISSFCVMFMGNWKGMFLLLLILLFVSC